MKTSTVLVKSYQNHHRMTLHDYPFLSKLTVKKFNFFIFEFFKDIYGSLSTSMC